MTFLLTWYLLCCPSASNIYSTHSHTPSCTLSLFRDKTFFACFSKIYKYFVPEKGQNRKGANMQPPRPSKYCGHNHLHMRPCLVRCVSNMVTNVEVSFHISFILEVAEFGVELAFGGVL